MNDLYKPLVKTPDTTNKSPSSAPSSPKPKDESLWWPTDDRKDIVYGLVVWTVIIAILVWAFWGIP